MTCTYCGFCKSVCPVFEGIGWDPSVARGRMILSYGLLQKDIPADESVVENLLPMHHLQGLRETLPFEHRSGRGRRAGQEGPGRCREDAAQAPRGGGQCAQAWQPLRGAGQRPEDPGPGAEKLRARAILSDARRPTGTRAHRPPHFRSWTSSARTSQRSTRCAAAACSSAVGVDDETRRRDHGKERAGHVRPGPGRGRTSHAQAATACSRRSIPSTSRCRSR